MFKYKLQKLFFYSILSISLSHSYRVMAQEANSASTQISGLINAGQFEQALSVIENELKNNPKDPLLRFQHGISLAGLGKNDDAIIDFTRLTEEYPQLPEPYNNLAVIYAYKNQLDKSRAALELAVKANPNYVAAHDNLGDIYTKLAASHYEKAAGLDSKNESAKSKLNMLSAIANLPIGSKQVYNSGISQSSQTKPAFSFKSDAASANSINKNAASKQEQSKAEKLEKSKAEKELKEKLKAEKATEKAEKVQKEKHKKETEKAAVTEKENKPLPAPSKEKEAKPEKQTAAASNPAEEQEVIKAVNAWAGAWSSKNVDSYLGHYAGNFKPSDGSSRANWEAGRKSRIGDKGNIDVSVSETKVAISGDTATVNFRQVYKSDKLHDTSQKTLIMTKVNGKWQIKQEKGN